MINDLIALIEGKLQKNTNEPKYIQLKQAIEDCIRNRLIANGSQLPSERKLADALGVSRVTVVNTLKALKEIGLISTQHGSGTRVNFPLDYNLSGGGFSSQLSNQGALSNRWITREIVVPKEDIRLALDLKKGIAVAKVKRVRLADEIPVSIETMFIPQEYLPRPELLENSLYQYWAEHNIYPFTQEYEINPYSLSQEEANLLEVPMNEPALKITLSSEDNEGNTLEYGYAICRSSSYNFKFKAHLGKN